ncbi:pyridoxamine 5'-phosphate oxidase family protein [Lentisphaerota bacterium ZTH]|nr:pyridoxamine 5'-phosphate oxidase family protein [Lentisphaerota bacterium]WET06684.1 pyridoxamine 5'-phosphate oxidase family protein [Lentisphaerota bacterium ZTH]
MRRKIQEISDSAELDEILSTARICRIAMLDGNRPYILPFNYGYRNKCVYIHCALQGRKLDLLRKNNHVCFEIEDSVRVVKDKIACRCSTRYRSIVGYGDIEIITDDAEAKNEALKILMEQHDWGEPVEFSEQQVKNVAILKLSITSMTGKKSSNWDKTQSH